MRVFVTGGTGFIGSRVVRALLDDGHTVTALSRRTGTNLEKLNVTIINGTLKDENVIAAAAAEADAVLHLGFEHDFSRFQECCEQDIKVVTVIIKALSGSGKLFVNTGGTFSAGETGDALGQEDTPAQGPRAKSEDITLQASESGVRGIVMRVPPFVYTKDFSGLYDFVYKAAEKKGSAIYIGAGDNKMCAVHVEDAARAYASCVTHKNARGAYNVVGQNGVTGKDIADITARKLQCKTESVSLEEALKLFSDIPVVAMVLSTNNQAGNSKALRELGWKPQHTRIQEEL